jgi:hypothetical protein
VVRGPGEHEQPRARRVDHGNACLEHATLCCKLAATTRQTFRALLALEHVLQRGRA